MSNEILFIGILLAVSAISVSAAEIHVAKSGSDSNTGTEASPYLTISQAAATAMPGDTVIVHAGTYRESVKPPRGGTGESQRITYRAAPGAEVFVKGSEQITSWTQAQDGTWSVTLPNEFFNGYNPYELNLTGPWLNYGLWCHRGAVYLNGRAFREKQTAAEVPEDTSSWFPSVTQTTTTIVANFGTADPNSSLTEINVRESLFMPTTSGLGYITVRGFRFLHAATNWAPPTISLQTGAVGPRMGKRWIIENCEVSDSRSVGIILGRAPGVDEDDIDAFGDHIVRNNIIRRCGQAGIAGQYGACRSLISRNLIEDTNYLREFGGYETSALKFHHSVDLTISHNLIRGVYRQSQAAYGIWIDYGNQGTRITGNIIYDIQSPSGIYLEMNHGPILVDNNVIYRERIRQHSSSSTVYAHNLFFNCDFNFTLDNSRSPGAYTPHTRIDKGNRLVSHRDTKWFNNIFVGKGLATGNGVSRVSPGDEADYNLFLDEAQPSSFGDENSVAAAAFNVPNRLEDTPLGVEITFTVNDAPESMTPERVTAQKVGTFDYAGQTIETVYGTPISVDTDFNGRPFSPIKVGPLADIAQGANTISWQYEQYESEALLINAFSATRPAYYTDWSSAGVTEDLSRAAAATVSIDGSGTVSDIVGGLTISDGGANAAGSTTFAGNGLLTDYFYGENQTVDISIGGFDDGAGNANTLTSTLGDMAGHSFSLKPNTYYKLYLFGAGGDNGQNTTFTFGGVEQSTNQNITDTERNDAHFVTYHFKTGTDLTDFTIDFSFANAASALGAWNGAAIVKVVPAAVRVFPKNDTESIFSFSGAAHSNYLINFTSDLNGNAFTPLTPTAASVGTLNGDVIRTDSNGDATVSLPANADSSWFYRVDPL